MTLDLENGDPVRAEASPTQRRRRTGTGSSSKESGSSSSSNSGGRPTSSERSDNEVASRLDRTFDRIVKQLEARGDTELAEIVREDGQAMARGLVNLTHSVKVLRTPLVLILNLVEPVMAFGRVARVLVHRFAERRMRRAEERAEELAQAEVVHAGA